MECKLYMKNEEVPENKEIFVYGFNNVNTANVGNYILIGCEWDDLYEHDKLFNSWFKKFIKKETEMRNFKIIGCFFTCVKKQLS